jgi:hypothetical protein
MALKQNKKRASRLATARRKSFQPQLERLEDRLYLAVTPMLSDGIVTVEMTASGDAATLSMADNNLRIFDGTNTWDFAAGSVNSVRIQGTSAANQTVNLKGSVRLSGLLEVAGVSDIVVSGQYSAESIDLRSSRKLTVEGSSEDPTLLSTRRIAAGGNLLTAVSTGDSGSLTLDSPSMVIDGASLLAHVHDGSPFSAGKVTLYADDSANRILPSIFPAGGLNVWADIKLDGATVKGGEIDIQAKSGDVALTASLPSGFGKSWTEGLISYFEQIPGLAISSLTGFHASVQVRASTSELTVANTTIEGSGKVSLISDAAADSSLRAVAVGGADRDSLQDAVTVAVGFGKANATAHTILSGTTQITAGGSVAIGSKANTRAVVNARATGNASTGESGESNPDNVSAAVAIAVTEIDSQTTVDSNVQIVSNGSVNIAATGTGKSTPDAGATIHEGGLAGITVSMGFDNVTINTSVNGTVTASGESGFFDPSSRVQTSTNTITLPNHGLKTGETIVYRSHGGEAIGGLKDGRRYAVIVVDDNTIRLADAAAIDLDTRGVDSTATHSLSKVVSAVFNPAEDIDFDNNTITVKNNSPLNGQKVIYRSPESEQLSGLIAGDEYTVEIPNPDFPSTFRLKDSEDQIVNLIKREIADSEDGDEPEDPYLDELHLVVYSLPEKSFNPVNDVHAGRETIKISGHGFADNDVIIYRTDPSKSHDVQIPVEDHDPIDFPNVNVLDTPIGGLQDGETYFVEVIDSETIRLMAYSNQVALAKPIDLKNVGTGARHSILPVGESTGLGIRATLEAENNSTAAAETGKEKPAAWSATIGAATSPQSFLQAITAFKAMKSVGDKVSDVSGQTKNDNGSGAGSVSVTYFNHHVDVEIGPSAVLESLGDLDVESKINQKVGVAATASATVVDGSEGNAAAVAIALGLYNNAATTRVETGARLDAHDTLNIGSLVEYPWIADPLDAINPYKGLQEGPAALIKFLDGNFGVVANLFNTTADASASSGKKDIAIGGTLAVTVFDNTAETMVESGVLINQSTAHDLRSGPQAVNVTAATKLKSLDMVGPFSFGLGPATGVKMAEATTPKARRKAFSDNIVKTDGVDGKSGIGASILVNVLNNRTVAEVGSGTKIYAGEEGLTVSADTDIFSFAFAQSGTKAKKFGIGGSAAGSGIYNVTHAIVAPGVEIQSGGDLSIKAHDQTTRINVVGGIAKSNSIGAGVSVAVNEVSRDTAAVLGVLDPNVSVALLPETDVTAAGKLTVSAFSDGDIWSFSLAGAFVSEETPEPPAAGPPTESPKAKKLLGGAEQPEPPPDLGIGIAGDVSFNRILANKAVAAIHTLGTIKAEEIAVVAEDDSNLWTLSGAVAIVRAGEKASIGIAGSFSVNLITEALTRAYVSDAELEAQSLTVMADQRGTIHALTASGAGAKNTNSDGIAVGVGASVSVNQVSSVTEAFLTNADVTTTADTTVTARNRSQIKALAGSVGVAISQNKSIAAGVSAAGNTIDSTVRAYVDGSEVKAQNISVRALGNPIINILTVGGAVTAAAGSESGLAASVAGALSVNTITSTVSAKVYNSAKLTGRGLIQIEADDTPYIRADGGGLALSLTSSTGTSVGLSVGVSAASNDVTSTVSATVDGSSVLTTTTAPRGVIVSAKSDATIKALTIGGAVSAAASPDSAITVAAAGAGSGNIISTSVVAAILGDSVVAADDARVEVKAEDKSTIIANAGGLGIALSASDTAVAVTVGLSASSNEITNTVRALIDNSTVSGKSAVAEEVGVVVSAIEDATIEALTIGGALAGGVGGGAGVGIGAAGAGSGNKIRNTVEAIIRNGADVQSSSGNVSLLASDTATIMADAGGLSIAAGLGGGGLGAAVSLGVAFADNNIANKVRAIIDDSEVRAPFVEVRARAEATIEALSFGGAVAVGAGSNVGGAVAVAGAGSYNTINNEIQASIVDRSIVRSTAAFFGAVNVNADDESTITANGGGIGIGVGVGGSGGGLGASLGFAAAKNSITTLVRATIEASEVSAPSLWVSATEEATIYALTIGGAVGVGAGGSAGVGIGAAGAGSGNTIRATVEAALLGIGSNRTIANIGGGGITIRAQDESTIIANAGGLGAGVGAGGTTGVGASLGVAFAKNDIQNKVRARIDFATVSAANDLHLTAKETATIEALTIGGAVAVGAGGSVGGAVAVAGAGSFNTIDNEVQATITDRSVINVAGSQALNINASDESSITANGGGIGVAVGAGGSAGGLGASLGFAAATNDVTTVVRATIVASEVTASSLAVIATEEAEIRALTIGGAVGVGAGGGAGVGVGAAGAGSRNTIRTTVEAGLFGSGANRTIANIGSGGITILAQDESTIIANAGGISAAVGAGGAAGVGASLGVAFARNDIQNTVRARVHFATINTDGDIDLTAEEKATITALTVGGAVAVGAGGSGAGVGAAVAGADSKNTIRNTVEATITGGSTIRPGASATNKPDITLTALDDSTITANGGGVGVAIGASGGAGVGAAVGFAAADNDVQNTVRTLVSESSIEELDFNRQLGNLVMSAEATAVIQALTIGGALAVGAAGAAGVGVGGAGAGSRNRIKNTIESAITSTSTVLVGKKLELTAKDRSTIKADGGAIGGAVGAAGVAGVGASLGVGYARNEITNSVQAHITSSTIRTWEAVKLTAIEDASITALTIGGAVAVGVGGGAGVAVAGAGAESINAISNTVRAYVSGDASITTMTGEVVISASDKSRIHADAGAVSVGAGVGTVGVGVTLGASVMKNEVRNTVQAYVSGSTITADWGRLVLEATEDAKITGMALGGAASVAGGVVAIAAAGAGARADNIVQNRVEAYALNSNLKAVNFGGNMRISALDTSVVEARAVAGALAAGFGFAGGAAAVGASIADNRITNTVRAYSSNSTLLAGQGDLILNAEAKPTTTALTIAASIAAVGAVAGKSFSGGGADSRNVINNTVASFVDGGSARAATGDVVITATEHAVMESSVGAVAIAGAPTVAASVSLSLAGNESKSAVAAYVKNASINADEGSVRIEALGDGSVSSTALSTSVAISVFGITGAGARANSTLTTTVAAYTEGNVSVVAEGDILVKAVGKPSTTADTTGIAIAASLGLSIGVSIADAINAPTVRANVAGNNIHSTKGNVTVTAAVDDLSNTANSIAVAAAVMGLAGSGTQANAISGPIVNAVIGNTTSVHAGGDIVITASSAGDSSAYGRGFTIAGGIAMGTTQANAAVGSGTIGGGSTREAETLIHVGNKAKLAAGRHLTIEATSSQKARSKTEGIQGGVFTFGLGNAMALRNVPVSVTTGSDAELDANRNISILAFNGYETAGDNVRAEATNVFGALLGAAVPRAVARVADGTKVTLGKDNRVDAALGNITVRATTADFGISSRASITGGSVVPIPHSEATTTTENPATTEVGTGTAITAGLTIRIESLAGASDSARATTYGGGLGTNSKAMARTFGSAHSTTTIGLGTTIQAGLDLIIHAGKNGVPASTANAETSGGGLGVDSTSLTVVQKSYFSNVEILGGSKLVAPFLVRVAAEAGATDHWVGLVHTSHARTSAGGLAGATYADATTDISRRARVFFESTANRTKVEGSDVQITADSSTSFNITRAERPGFVLLKGGDQQERRLTPVHESIVDLNADVLVTGGVALLHIDQSGNVVAERNVNYLGLLPNLWYIRPISFDGGGKASVTAVQGNTSVIGNGTFTYSRGMGRVTLINERPDRELLIEGIGVAGIPSNILTVSPPRTGGGFAQSTADISTATPITIESAGGIRVAGNINNLQGITKINTFDRDIVSAGGTINANHLQLAGRAIGSSSGRLSLVLTYPNEPPTFSAAATGDMFLDFRRTYAGSVGPYSLSGQKIDLVLGDNYFGPDIAATTWNFNIAGTELSIVGGHNAPAHLMINSPGDLTVGSIVSRKGDVSLTAGGLIRSRQNQSATSIAGNNITLIAGTGGIGSGNPNNQLILATAHSGPGVLTATAPGDIVLRHSGGNVSVNQVRSTNGSVSLRASSKILDGRSGTNPPKNFQASQGITLTGSELGEATKPLDISGSTLMAHASAGSLWINNTSDSLTIVSDGTSGLNANAIHLVTSGALIVDKPVTSNANGNVNLKASGAMTVKDAVSAGTGTVVLEASSLVLEKNLANGGNLSLTTTGAMTLKEAVTSNLGTITIQAASLTADKLIEGRGIVDLNTGTGAVHLKDTLRSTTGAITVKAGALTIDKNVTSPRAISLDASGNVGIAASSRIESSEAGVSVKGAELTVGAGALFRAATTANIQVSSLTAGANLIIQGPVGVTLTTTGATSLGAGSRVESSVEKVTIHGGSLSTGAGAVVQGRKAVVLDLTGGITLGSGSKLEANAGDVSIDGASLTASENTQILGPKGVIMDVTGAIAFGASSKVESNVETVTIEGGSLATGSNAIVQGRKGVTLDMDGEITLATGSKLEATAGSISIDGNSITTQGNVPMLGSDGVTLTASEAISLGTSSRGIASAGDVNLRGGSITTFASVLLQGSMGVTLDAVGGAVTLGDNSQLQSTGAVVKIDGDSITFGSKVVVTSPLDVLLGAENEVTLGKDSKLDANASLSVSGSMITVESAALLQGRNGVTLTGSESITLETGSKVQSSVAGVSLIGGDVTMEGSAEVRGTTTASISGSSFTLDGGGLLIGPQGVSVEVTGLISLGAGSKVEASSSNSTAWGASLKGESIWVGSNALVRGTGICGLHLTATGDITIETGSVLDAGSQPITITSTGSAGHTISLGNTFSADSVSITSGSGDDTISLAVVPALRLSVDGGDGTNTLQFQVTNGNDNITVTADTISLGVTGFDDDFTYQNIQILGIDSLGGDDVFNVTGASFSGGIFLSGRDNVTLNMTGNQAFQNPVTFTGGSGTNVVNLTGSRPAAVDDVLALEQIGLFNARDFSGSFAQLPRPEHRFPVSNNIVGAGMTLQVHRPTAINLTLPGDRYDVSILDSRVPTTVRLLDSESTLSVGGSVSRGQQTYTRRNLGTGFTSPLTLISSSTSNSVRFDNSSGSTAPGSLHVDTIKGLGESVDVFKFTGFGELTVDVGAGDFFVENTISGPVTINAPAANITLRKSAASLLTIYTGGPTSTAVRNTIVFDNSMGTAAIHATLEDDDALAGNTKVTGFGPIGPVTFRGFAQADLRMGSGNDTLNIDSTSQR